MDKILTIEDVFESKTYVKDNREYKSPKEYLSKFVEMTKDVAPDLTVQVSGKIQNAEEDRTINTAYSRILIEASNVKLKKEGIIPTFGILIGLDPQTPVYRMYEGMTVSACTNLCVFNSNNLFTGNVFEGLNEGYAHLDSWMENWKDTFGRNLDIFGNMENTRVTPAELEQKLGALLKFGLEHKYLGTNPIVHAAKELYNPSSMYHVEEDGTTDWNLYNAVTSYISGKTDIMDKAAKTLLLSKFFTN